jgi:hypothetical protein
LQQTVAHGVIIDWEWTNPGWLRIVLALAMLIVTAAVAGRRIAWLVKLIRSGKKDDGRKDNLQERLKDELL